MKKCIAMLIAAIMLFGAVPVFAGNEPYVVLSEFNDGELMGVVVKANEDFSGDFVLIAALCKDDTVLGVKTMGKGKLSSGREISFDAVEGGEIKLFAWESVAGMQPARDNYLSTLTYEEIISDLKLANDYWIGRNNTISNGTNPWEVAVFHTGNMQAYYMTGDEAYRNYSKLWSDAHLWQSYGYPTWDTTNADNICCFRTYIDLYNIDSENANIDYVKNQVDYITGSTRLSYWNWIDAFYMAGPIFTKMYEMTGEVKYLDKMYEMIKYTAETLGCYDEEVGLWFRDASFIDDVSENGEGVYWSRGDGWVYGAFAQIIEELPDSYEHKDYFVDIFLEMSAALKKAQCEDGAWHESLLDPDYNPDCEESGTGFFVYGMLWGINNGYLEEDEYLSCAVNGWKWLSEVALQDNGQIGYVQSIGARPTKDKLYDSMTQHYAYANFVYAASEMAKYIGGMQGDVVPYLQKKLLGNIEVYKKDSQYAIKNGEIIECDVNCEELTIPEGMYLHKQDNIYVVSEFITPFNKTEENLFDVLDEILTTGKFPERAYSDPDRIPLKVKGDNSDVVIDAAIPETTTKPEATAATKIALTSLDVEASYVAEAYNGPECAVDGDYSTRCALEVLDAEEPEYIQFNLGGEKEVNTIGISFYRGDIRTSYFSVSVSTDGVNYTEVIPLSATSGETTQIEYYVIEPVKASYLRLYGYGNDNVSLSQWFSPTEVEIYGEYDPDAPSTDVDDGSVEFDVTASIVTEPSNGPENVHDGNFDTYCVLYVTDTENPEYMQFDLGEVMAVEKVALAFRAGTTRTTTFHVEASEDGENYNVVVPKTTSSGTTNNYEYFDINQNARYIRIYGYENSANRYWVSFTEAALYATK